jgi:alpha-L-arabinofuranosidase
LGVSTTRSSTLELQLDASRTNALINPFIEHLGGCIYGCIWAELLEDRKFYFLITAEYAPYRSLTDTAFRVVGPTPWQILGEPARELLREGHPAYGEARGSHHGMIDYAATGR